MHALYSESVKLTPYDGQVKLCPPDQETSNSDIEQSISYGIPALYFTDYNVWRGIVQKGSNEFLGNAEANAICRQMGYTGAIPGSAIARNATNYTFENC